MLESRSSGIAPMTEPSLRKKQYLTAVSRLPALPSSSWPVFPILLLSDRIWFPCGGLILTYHLRRANLSTIASGFFHERSFYRHRFFQLRTRPITGGSRLTSVASQQLIAQVGGETEYVVARNDHSSAVASRGLDPWKARLPPTERLVDMEL